jgi:hypothetical protein
MRDGAMHSRTLTRSALGRGVTFLAAAFAAALVVAPIGSSAGSAGCAFCGKNLIKDPGAEGARGLTAPGAKGAVPGWTNTAGQFSAGAYTGFGIGWFNATTKGPTDRGKNYFFGGTTTEATTAAATIGTQTIPLPASAAGHKATLSGWLGNYPPNNTAKVLAQFLDNSGKVLVVIRIGPDTTIAGQDMALRTRSATVPPGAVNVAVVVTFTDHANYSLAGADNLSLVIS